MFNKTYTQLANENKGQLNLLSQNVCLDTRF